MTKAKDIIARFSRYLEAPPHGYAYYQSWVADEEGENPGISASIRTEALELIGISGGVLLRSAIQALACIGTREDSAVLEPLVESDDGEIASEASAAVAHIALRHTSLETLLDGVRDRESFVRFAEALAKERDLAAMLERDNPERYCIDGALGWKNADIASFIYAGLTAFTSEPAELSWPTLAAFLYNGKVVE